MPTRVQIDNFPTYAEQARREVPGVRRAHARPCTRRADATLRAAHEAGVADLLPAPTPGGVLPHGLVGREVLALHQQVGLPAEVALGGASWAARDWLGRPASTPGESADLVVYDADPRADLGVLAHPRAVVLRGRVVA